MKSLKSVLFLLSFGITLVSCTKEKNSEGVSRQTDYPNFTVNGSSEMFVTKGSTYTEPGVTATEGGSSIDVTSAASGNYRGGSTLDVNVDDHYVVTYSATNKDGFSGSVTRDVYVANTGDLTTSIEGLYTATVVRDGVVSPQYQDMKYVLIWKNSDGTYELSDGIGGYYAFGRGYGLGYIGAGAKVTANDISANDFSYEDFSVNTFGGTVTMSNMTVDAANKTINFASTWSFGYVFDVTLTQVQF